MGFIGLTYSRDPKPPRETKHGTRTMYLCRDALPIGSLAVDFLWLVFRIQKGNPKKDLLRSLWVDCIYQGLRTLSLQFLGGTAIPFVPNA